MDKLYIKVIDGVITDHPMLDRCVKVLHPEFDGTILPNGIKEFVRVPQPDITLFQKIEGTYAFDGDKVTDVWTITNMTEEEKQEVINSLGQLPEGVSIDLNTCRFINSNPIDENIKVADIPL